MPSHLYVVGPLVLFRKPQLPSYVNARHVGLAMQLDSMALMSPQILQLAPP